MAKSVLICDDAAFMRVMIKDILTKNGYDVAGEAENGLKAVEKYNETKPDLVMMDITMPEMDGIQALKKIKEADANATVIIALLMGVVVYFVGLLQLPTIIVIFIQIITGAAIYIGVSLVLHLEEFEYLFGMIKSFLKR